MLNDCYVPQTISQIVKKICYHLLSVSHICASIEYQLISVLPFPYYYIHPLLFIFSVFSLGISFLD